MPKPEIIIAGLREQLSQNPKARACILVGSQTKTVSYPPTPYSDIEAYIITSDQDKDALEATLPDFAGHFGTILFSFQHAIGFVAVYDDLLRLELPVTKESEMAAVFSRPKSQAVTVLFDKTPGTVQKILDKRPDSRNYAELFQSLMINYWYWQVLGVQYFTNGELYNARAIANIHAGALIKLFELLNDPQILLLETNKRVEHFLNEEQLIILSEMTPSYDRKQIKNALLRSMDIFTKVAWAIQAKYGYTVDEEIAAKTKPKLERLLDSP